uniref:Uncharacterized protein n=1 Tax=Leersia perrieri TaxID=77586 RepID=A0A0D9XY32_9ORYZ
MEVPMCFCGDLCRIIKSDDYSNTYSKMIFIYENYEYNPPKDFRRAMISSPPHVFAASTTGLTKNRRQEREQKQEEKRRRVFQVEMHRNKEEWERQEAESREADKKRKRERIHRVKAAGPEAIHKEKYPRCTL